MARAEVDLDDPANGRNGAALSSADDLLAQLAGDEVERMLSEADAAAPEPLNIDRAVPDLATGGPSAVAIQVADPAIVKPPAITAPTSDDAVLEATEAALDGLFDEPDASSPQSALLEAAPQSAPSAAPSGDPIAPAKAAPIDKQSIEEVITQRAQDLIAQARLDADLDPLPVATDAPLSAADALAAEMDEDERAHMAALKRMKEGSPAKPPDPSPLSAKASAPVESLPASDAVAAQNSATTQIDEDKVDFTPLDKAARVPLLIRVLELINAPLAGFSDSVRAAIGKVAIVTMLNAVGVFVYVVVFRRH